MGMTMTQKILAAAANKPSVAAGELIIANLSLVLGNDITSPVAISEFTKAGFTKLYDNERVCMVMDHFAPNKDIKSAEQCKTCRTFCNDKGVVNFFDVGKMGIEHALLPEQGLVTAGDTIIGADSHTCTYGALGAFSTGVGSTDMAYGMAEGTCWFKVPKAIKVILKNKLSKNVSGKDVILHLIGKIGVDGAIYQSLEFTGEGVKSLTIDDRFTICNMAIEAGAKNGIFPVDEITLAYLNGRSKREPKIFTADSDAEYASIIEIDLSTLKQTIAFPHLPDNTKEIGEFGDIKIDQVVIGSCTNGHISDLAIAASVFKGKTVAPNVRTIIIPATNEIYLEAINKGYIEVFIRAGAIVSTPTCGPCLGGHMGILASEERCVATTNRNFIGRMGHITSEIYLASPFVAACSAVLGKIGIIEN